MNTNGSFFNFSFLLDLDEELERTSLLSLISGKTLYNLITGIKQEKNHSSVKESIAYVIQIIDDYLVENSKANSDKNRIVEISFNCHDGLYLNFSFSFYSEENLSFVCKILKTKYLIENLFDSKEPMISKKDSLYTLNFKLQI